MEYPGLVSGGRILRRVRASMWLSTRILKARMCRLMFAVLALITLCGAPVLAQCPSGGTCWVGSTTGSWSAGGNWSNGVPGSGTNVFIDNGNPQNSAVTMDLLNGQAANLAIDSGDRLTISNGNALTTNGSTISDAGTLALASTGSTTQLVLNADATLTGGGTISLSNNANNLIIGDALTNVNNVIQGSGTILLPLLNQGTVNANQSTPLTVNFGEAGVNSGTLEATNSGTRHPGADRGSRWQHSQQRRRDDFCWRYVRGAADRQHCHSRRNAEHGWTRVD
jgi:hypothetical protein